MLFSPFLACLKAHFECSCLRDRRAKGRGKFLDFFLLFDVFSVTDGFLFRSQVVVEGDRLA